MTTNLISPPPVSPHTADPGSPSARGAGSIIAILLGILGGMIALGAVALSTLSTIASASTETSIQSVAVAGVTELDVDASGGTMEVVFADVSEATLEVTSGLGSDSWTLRRDDDALEVASPHGWFGGWWGGWLTGPSHATLTLPSALEGRLAADLELSAGTLEVTGEFTDVEVDVSAGSLRFDGALDTIAVDVSAGRADISLTAARTADFSLSAGVIDAQLTGTPPVRVGVDVSAGNMNLTLPDGSYDTRVAQSAGSVDNGLRVDPGAANTVTVNVSAGSVSLRAR